MSEDRDPVRLTLIDFLFKELFIVFSTFSFAFVLTMLVFFDWLIATKHPILWFVPEDYKSFWIFWLTFWVGLNTLWVVVVLIQTIRRGLISWGLWSHDLEVSLGVAFITSLVRLWRGVVWVIYQVVFIWNRFLDGIGSIYLSLRSIVAFVFNLLVVRPYQFVQPFWLAYVVRPAVSLGHFWQRYVIPYWRFTVYSVLCGLVMLPILLIFVGTGLDINFLLAFIGNSIGYVIMATYMAKKAGWYSRALPFQYIFVLMLGLSVFVLTVIEDSPLVKVFPSWSPLNPPLPLTFFLLGILFTLLLGFWMVVVLGVFTFRSKVVMSIPHVPADTSTVKTTS